MQDATPELSVVIVVLVGQASLTRCLHAFAQQQAAPPFEVIIPCDARHPITETWLRDFPFAKVAPMAGSHTYAELRTWGIQQARGAIVAITEDHCRPRPDWCRQIVQAHQASHAAIGGAVEKLAPDTALNWSFYLADYVRYMHPAPAGFATSLTDCNVAYKRAALAQIAQVWAVEFHETSVHHALRMAGATLWFSPNIVVQQQRSLRLAPALRDRYEFGRLFGSERTQGATLPRRLLYLLCSPLLPFVLVGRVARLIVEKRVYFTPFLRSLPFLILICIAWAWGEFLGYWTGVATASLQPQPSSPQSLTAAQSR